MEMIDDARPRRRRGSLALLLLCHIWAAVSAVSLGQDAAPKKRLDLSNFRPPSFDQQPTGTFAYTSPLGGPGRSIVIRQTQDDIALLEGVAGADAAHPLLKLEKVPKSISYRGLAEIEFDPCLGSQARVENAVAYPERLSLEVLVPYSTGSRGKTCGPLDYFVRSRDVGQKIRLKPRGELGLTTVDAEGKVSRDYGRQIGMPRIDDGSPVSVVESLVSDQGIRWCRVKSLAATEKDEDPPAGWVRAEQVVARVRYTLERR